MAQKSTITYPGLSLSLLCTSVGMVCVRACACACACGCGGGGGSRTLDFLCFVNIITSQEEKVSEPFVFCKRKEEEDGFVIKSGQD